MPLPLHARPGHRPPCVIFTADEMAKARATLHHPQDYFDPELEMAANTLLTSPDSCDARLARDWLDVRQLEQANA